MDEPAGRDEARYPWWRFWSSDPWKEWRVRRPQWRQYKSEVRGLDRSISDGETRLKRTNSSLAEANQQIAWASEVHPQDLPIKIAQAEAGLAVVPGVALLETRKRQGKTAWVPVDHGVVYLTDRQAIFSGSKQVKFRYDTLTNQDMTPSGLHLVVSTRQRSHILSGPAEKLSALITACISVGAGAEPTAAFSQRADALTHTVNEIEQTLDVHRRHRKALVPPPRPISPAWLPAAVFLAVFGFGANLGDGSDPLQLAAPSSTTTAPVATSTLDPSTTTMDTTTTVVPTTTEATVATVPDAEVIFAPPTAGASGDPGQPLPSGAETVSVSSISDGDTIGVEFPDGTIDTVRLIGVNSPEAGECWYEESGLAIASLAAVGDQIGMTPDTTDRDQFGRLLRYLWVGGMSINEELVRRGAAISRRYPPDTAMAARFEAAQQDAQTNAFGLWAPDACGPAASARLTVTGVEYDAPGDDNTNLNEEYIEIRNAGSNLVDMTGWGIRDESSSNRYSFPVGYVIAAGETITIYSGCGDNFGSFLYWCSVGSAVWNNDGDSVFIVDPSGNIHASRSYVGNTTTSTTTTTQPTATTSGRGGNCDPSYPTVCIPPPPPDLDCGEISFTDFSVTGSDPHGFDGDNDGVGCET